MEYSIIPFREKSNAETSSVKYAYFQWIHQVESSRGVPDEVTALYADNAVLFPTLSSDTFTGTKMINNYFVIFLKLNDLKVETKELITRVYGDLAMNAGNFEISYRDGDKIEVIKVRFNFWYQKIREEWKIIFHQSCRLPKPN